MDVETALRPMRYGGRADLPTFLAFASTSVRARAPIPATWHPGDLVWQLRGQYDRRHVLYGFRTGDELGAVAWFQGAGELLFEALPAYDRLVDDALAWCVEKARAAPAPTRAAELRVAAFDRDGARGEALERAGFRRAGPHGVQFERSLDEPLAPTPPEWRLRDCVGIDPDARSKVHRDAWSALGHLGIEGASTFSTALYESLLSTETYDPALDIVAEAPDGALVANCIAWADLGSGVGVFEPVGVHPDYRGRALAGAVMAEAMRRLKSKGLRVARVGTAHFNNAAIAAYRRGFAPAGASSLWVRSLQEG